MAIELRVQRARKTRTHPPDPDRLFEQEVYRSTGAGPWQPWDRGRAGDCARPDASARELSRRPFSTVTERSGSCAARPPTSARESASTGGWQASGDSARLRGSTSTDAQQVRGSSPLKTSLPRLSESIRSRDEPETEGRVHASARIPHNEYGEDGLFLSTASGCDHPIKREDGKPSTESTPQRAPQLPRKRRAWMGVRTPLSIRTDQNAGKSDLSRAVATTDTGAVTVGANSRVQERLRRMGSGRKEPRAAGGRVCGTGFG